jgi:hypothetical protein
MSWRSILVVVSEPWYLEVVEGDFTRKSSASALAAAMPLGIVTLFGCIYGYLFTLGVSVKTLDHFSLRDNDTLCHHPLGL